MNSNLEAGTLIFTPQINDPPLDVHGYNTLQEQSTKETMTTIITLLSKLVWIHKQNYQIKSTQLQK